MSFLREKYQTETVPTLMDDLGIENQMNVPEVEKVVINMGLGEAVDNPKIIDEAVDELELITGQTATVTRARRSVAAFKVREGMPIGAKVTLRGKRMYEFMERLIYVALPRERDFTGISENSFDGHGNYTLGLEEQTIFPEIDIDNVDRVRGMNVTVVTTADTDEGGRVLLNGLGFPFEKKSER